MGTQTDPGLHAALPFYYLRDLGQLLCPSRVQLNDGIMMPACGIVRVRDSVSNPDTVSSAHWTLIYHYSVCHPAVVSQFQSRLSCDLGLYLHPVQILTGLD